MSTFYVVLYIFIAIVALLCLVSLVMYLCRVFSKSKDYDEEQFFTTKGRNLNSTATTEVAETSQLITNGPSTSREGDIELVNVRQRVEAYEHGPPASAPSAPRKPPVAPRPSSIAKPHLSAHPSAPPTNQPVEVAIVHPQLPYAPKSNTVKKPKAPPPPPPESFYQNVDKTNHQSPPPDYDDVMLDIPVDNYLSDND